MPRRTCCPLHPSTLTSTSSPMQIASPIRRVRINMSSCLHFQHGPDVLQHLKVVEVPHQVHDLHLPGFTQRQLPAENVRVHLVQGYPRQVEQHRAVLRRDAYLAPLVDAAGGDIEVSCQFRSAPTDLDSFRDDFCWCHTETVTPLVLPGNWACGQIFLDSWEKVGVVSVTFGRHPDRHSSCLHSFSQDFLGGGA